VDRSQLISGVCIGLLIVLDVFVLAPAFRSDAESDDVPFPGQHGGQFLMCVAFVTIWWPDMIGAGLCRNSGFMPLSDSGAIVVRCLGWIGLCVVIVMRVYCVRRIMG
jgi:hypothetical protein